MRLSKVRRIHLDIQGSTRAKYRLNDVLVILLRRRTAYASFQSISLLVRAQRIWVLTEHVRTTKLGQFFLGPEHRRVE